VDRTGVAIAALRSSKEASRGAADIVEHLDHLLEHDRSRLSGKREAAPRASCRLQQTPAGERVEDLGQIVPGDAERLRHLVDGNRSSALFLRQIVDRLQRVDRGLREDQDRAPLYGLSRVALRG